MTDILSGLNEFQKRAVTTTGGPLLIVAGPGTGKTLTIVRRIAYLITQGVRPEDILAVTFTNRAAREMQARTEALLGDKASRIFIGTLHVLGLRMMQAAASSAFTVYGREEQVDLLKSLIKGSAGKARHMAERISRIKNFLENPNSPSPSVVNKGQTLNSSLEEDRGGFLDVQEIYEAYQAALRQRRACDFDDLILAPIEILKNSPSAAFVNNCTRLMVDEYQDINPAQYLLLRLLTRNNANLCVIGDSDQAVYGFRGADAGAFLSFNADFTNAATVMLTENYRSSAMILVASNNLIKNNQKRLGKTVIPTRGQGSRINDISVPDERIEGEFIVREIEARIGGTSHYQMIHSNAPREASTDSFAFSDFAVIYRTNAQAKAVEEAFSASGIPYQVIGRKSSLQSKELEETIAYLRSLARIDGGEAGASDSNEAKLLSPADFFDPRANVVTLTTMHTVKGLEFRVVFIAGVEDGLIPYTMTKHDVDLEEERRLFYVGMTRAKDELFLLHARNRFLYGQRLATLPSPFLGEIPAERIEKVVVPDKKKKQKGQDKQMGLF